MEKFDHSLVAATMRGYDRNNLFNFISTVIGKDEATRLMEMYRVGASKHWNGATVFWQISADGDVRGGKIMLYDRTPCAGTIPSHHMGTLGTSDD